MHSGYGTDGTVMVMPQFVNQQLHGPSAEVPTMGTMLHDTSEPSRTTVAADSTWFIRIMSSSWCA